MLQAGGAPFMAKPIEGQHYSARHMQCFFVFWKTSQFRPSRDC